MKPLCQDGLGINLDELLDDRLRQRYSALLECPNRFSDAGTYEILMEFVKERWSWKSMRFVARLRLIALMAPVNTAVRFLSRNPVS